MEIAIKEVLTKRRKLQLDTRPLTITDFVHPLSKLYCCNHDEYKELEKFTDNVTGIKDRRKAKFADEDDKKKTNKRR